MADPVNEEQFILFTQDEELAARLQQVLNSDTGTDDIEATLHFETARVGRLLVSWKSTGVTDAYAVSLHELDTLIETYKSHNHINLVKSADIGQILCTHSMGRVGDDGSCPDLDNAVIALISSEEQGTLPARLHANAGITPPMRIPAAVSRRTFPDVTPDMVGQVETQILSMVNGEAPEGWLIEDTAEVFIIDQETGKGKWVPVSTVDAAKLASK